MQDFEEEFQEAFQEAQLLNKEELKEGEQSNDMMDQSSLSSASFHKQKF